MRRLPQFDTVTAVNSTWSSSIYHALEVKIEKRYAKGLAITGSYTRSKVIDYENGAFAGETLGGGGIQDWQNRRGSRSASTLDQPNRFIANAVYELPGKSKLAVGWEVGAILSLFSGGPVGVALATNHTFPPGSGQRPNRTGVNTAPPHPTPHCWNGPSPFFHPPAFAFRDVGRTL